MWHFSSAVLAALLQAENVKAFFSMKCSKLVESRIDPLVSPGAVSRHLNTFVGGSSKRSNTPDVSDVRLTFADIGQSSTYNDLSGSTCTSCEVSKDKSAYWTPQLYYQLSNGSFIMVPHDGSTVYYHGRGASTHGIVQYKAIPHGFGMFTGNVAARSYDSATQAYSNNAHAGTPIADRVSWSCLGGAAQSGTPGFPATTKCPGGLLAHIDFQSCWNGVDLYKPDNSHVAYLSQVVNGICPPSYPYLLPHISIETLYTVTDPMFSTGGRLVLSTGDTTGYGYYAGFINAWDDGVLQSTINNCLGVVGSSGSINDCPILLANDNKNTATQCPHKNPIVNEQIYGALNALPGCHKITSGPAPATDSDMTCLSSSPLSTTSTLPPTLNTATSTSALASSTTQLTSTSPVVGQNFGRSNWNYAGCYIDVAASRILGAWSYQDNTGLTIEACQTYCQSHGQKYAGVESGNQCFCDNYIRAASTASNTNQCNSPCTGGAARSCGGSGTIAIFNNTAAPPPPVPSVLAKSGTYLSKGCYKETAQSGAARTLGDAQTTTMTMNADACVKYCLGQNLRYAGVENG